MIGGFAEAPNDKPSWCGTVADTREMCSEWKAGQIGKECESKRGKRQQPDVPNNSSRYGSKVISTLKAHLKGLEGQSLIEERNV